MMLCGISVAFNSVGDVLGLVSYQCGSEHRQVLVGFQASGDRSVFNWVGAAPVNPSIVNIEMPSDGSMSPSTAKHLRPSH
jgi:hypothetical protein